MDDILELLKLEFDVGVSKLIAIDGGERSKAFVFISRGKKYIFRKNRHELGFLKDKFASENFGKQIPIPEIIKIGQFGDGYYSISEFCDGLTLSNKDFVFSDSIILDLVNTLDKIHSIKVDHVGFGIANAHGKAKYQSWKEWILKDVASVTKSDGSFYTWNEIKGISFVDKNIIDKLLKEIDTLSSFVPNISNLIHGDFASGNILVKNNQVSGVIDWNEFGYGDFLFDVAWLDFWTPNIDFVDVYQKHSEKQGRVIPNYLERIKSHKLFIGLTALGLYAAIGLKDTYDNILERIANIVELE